MNFFKQIISQNQFDPELILGKEINNITFVSLLGCGAMGAVFIGYQKSLKRKVAIKIFPKTSPESSKMSLRLRDEAQTVAILNHPNIVPVFDMGETDDFIFIIMQLIDGEDLRSYLHRFLLHPIPSRRVIPLQTSIGIMIKVIDALAYAHEEGVIHRDIKPANIILEKKSNRPYLADFGIAISTITEDTKSGSVAGTPLYMAPEQIAGKEIDNRADIYSAGVVLYELIAGKLPVDKTNLDEVIKLKMYDPDHFFRCQPSETSKLIDKELEQIILRATASAPNDRYLNCKELHKALLSYYEKVFPDIPL